MQNLEGVDAPNKRGTTAESEHHNNVIPIVWVLLDLLHLLVLSLCQLLFGICH